VRTVGPSYKLQVPPLQERIARQREDARRMLAQRASEQPDYQAGVVELLFAVGLAHAGLTYDSPHAERILVLAGRTFEAAADEVPGVPSSRRMVAAITAAVDLDRERSGY